MNSNIVEEIIQLRKQRLGMKTIAKMLGVTIDKVRYHCRENGLGGVLADNPTVDNAFEIFLNNIEKNHGNKVEYVSGFIDSEKPVLIRCKQCHHEFERAAQFARKKVNLTCPKCIRIKRAEVKQQRGIAKKPKIQTLRKKIWRNAIKPKPILKEIHMLKCHECGAAFGGRTRGRTLCSKTCSNRRDNRLKELRKRKARKNGKVDYSITIKKLIQKEKNVCYLCGGQCNSNDFTIDNRGSFIVGRNYPSIEHVIPISKGGTHSWDNVKLAHHYCNTIKNDKEICNEHGQMMLLI